MSNSFGRMKAIHWGDRVLLLGQLIIDPKELNLNVSNDSRTGGVAVYDLTIDQGARVIQWMENGNAPPQDLLYSLRLNFLGMSNHINRFATVNDHLKDANGWVVPSDYKWQPHVNTWYPKGGVDFSQSVTPSWGPSFEQDDFIAWIEVPDISETPWNNTLSMLTFKGRAASPVGEVKEIHVVPLLYKGERLTKFSDDTAETPELCESKPHVFMYHGTDNCSYVVRASTKDFGTKLVAGGHRVGAFPEEFDVQFLFYNS